jgi:hypothetical protein
MKSILVTAGLAALCLLLPTILVTRWVGAAGTRLEESSSAAAGTGGPAVAVASAADEGYCSTDLRKILRRVLTSCGLAPKTEAGGAAPSGGGELRGCMPVEAKSDATVSGEDFNALFLPMKDRGGILEFDKDSADLDAEDLALVDKLFADQRGASYFFVVSRASPEGSVTHNRELSRKRAESVMAHLRETFKDPDLDKEVGLLWLGEEFAQLDPSFCEWRRSGAADSCKPAELNRSAFIAWIDCKL